MQKLMWLIKCWYKMKTPFHWNLRRNKQQAILIFPRIMDPNELQTKFEACYGSNILSMEPEYDPYTKNKRNDILFDTAPLSIKKLPCVVFKQFMKLICGLIAHKLSFTCKTLYTETIKLRKINIRIDSFDLLPRYFKNTIFTFLLEALMATDKLFYGEGGGRKLIQ